jgi:hypothetical protein
MFLRSVTGVTTEIQRQDFHAYARKGLERPIPLVTLVTAGKADKLMSCYQHIFSRTAPASLKLGVGVSLDRWEMPTLAPCTVRVAEHESATSTAAR